MALLVFVKMQVAEKFVFWRKFAGLLKLQNDVRACEYEDIRVMWEILNRNESEFGHSPKKTNKGQKYWKLFKWARCAPYICRS